MVIVTAIKGSGNIYHPKDGDILARRRFKKNSDPAIDEYIEYLESTIKGPFDIYLE